MQCPLVSHIPQAHLREHSLDIQLPFIQIIFSPAVPPIVPILVGRISAENYPALSACIAGILDNDTVVVVSSDFTHYGPRFGFLPFPYGPDLPGRIAALDNGACRHILTLDRSGFLQYRRTKGRPFAGFSPSPFFWICFLRPPVRRKSSTTRPETLRVTIKIP